MEKLIEVERLIQEARAVGGAPPGSERHRQIMLLKSIAGDLRGRLESAPSVALHELERRLVLLSRRPNGGDFRVGHINAQRGVAEELVARWPTVKQALESFDQTINQVESR
jgi:hypothetical protein